MTIIHIERQADQQPDRRGSGNEQILSGETTAFKPARQHYFLFILRIAALLLLFLTLGSLLRRLDPVAAVVDVGALSLLVLGMLCGLALVMCSLWAQQLLWYTYRAFGNSFHSHFNQLTSWQQLLLYFGVFFLLLFAFVACLWAVC